MRFRQPSIHEPSQSVSVGLTRRSFLLSGFGAALSLPANAQTLNKSGRSITVGQVSLSFYAVTGAVVSEVLRRLGYNVIVREGPHERMFPMLANGEIDLMAAAWLPEGHASYWSKYGKSAVEVATLYEGARFFWAVPAYVSAEVTSIADLAKPEIASRMLKDIQGIGSGAAISVLSVKALEVYGLNGLGYSFKPGTQNEWIGAFNKAAEEKRWFVFPTWAPQYLNLGGGLRPLDDGKGVLGATNHAGLVAPKPNFETLPDRTKEVLSRVKIGIDGVSQMDRAVNVDKKSPRAAAEEWMRANETTVREWFRP